MHVGVVPSVVLFGRKEFLDVADHIETRVDPLRAEYEITIMGRGDLFDALS